MTSPTLSVVVIGRNEGDRLLACIESVQRAQNMPHPMELIYVDSRSGDGSPACASAAGAKVIVLGAGKMSAARARNAGWRMATAPYILFLDGDTTLDANFVHTAMERFADAQVAVVWGQRREVQPEASIYNRICDLDWISRPGYTESCGGDALMRRSVLEQTNGYNPDLIAGEEPDLCRRIRGSGGKILHLAAPMTKHDLGFRYLNQYWRRAVRTGHAYAEISTIYQRTSDPLWSEESRGNLLRGVLYLSVFLAACIATAVLRSALPLAVLGIGALVLAIRTAFLSRWKGVSWATLLLFGIHSHAQHVPILQGQLLYFWGRWRGQRRELIEYKSS